MSSTATIKPEKSIGQLMIAALIAGILAAVVNLVLFFVGGAIVGPIEVAMAPGDPVTPLPAFMVVVASIVPAVVAALVLWLLRRFFSSGTRIFVILAVVLTLLSMAAPLGQAGTMGAGIVLALMHVVTGGMIIWFEALRP